jgi:hypothetical protein
VRGTKVPLTLTPPIKCVRMSLHGFEPWTPACLKPVVILIRLNPISRESLIKKTVRLSLYQSSALDLAELQAHFNLTDLVFIKVFCYAFQTAKFKYLPFIVFSC